MTIIAGGSIYKAMAVIQFLSLVLSIAVVESQVIQGGT